MVGRHESPLIRRRAVDSRVLIVSKSEQIRLLPSAAMDADMDRTVKNGCTRDPIPRPRYITKRTHSPCARSRRPNRQRCKLRNACVGGVVRVSVANDQEPADETVTNEFLKLTAVERRGKTRLQKWRNGNLSPLLLLRRRQPWRFLPRLDIEESALERRAVAKIGQSVGAKIVDGAR